AAGTLLQSLRHSYDPSGNVTRITDGAQATVYFRNQVVDATASYTYDALYRLVSATGREHIGQAKGPQVDWHDSPHVNQPLPNDGQAMRRYAESYDYDPVGNLTAIVHSAYNSNWRRAYNYDALANRLLSTQSGAAVERYEYDAHGNMVSMPHLPLMEWN